MNHNDKRKLVLKFIEENQGCNIEKIVKKLADDMCRKIVFDIIKEFKNEETIIDQSTNRRDHAFYPNKNNHIFIIQKQLDKFIESFLVLLESTSSISDKTSKLISIDDNEIKKILKIFQSSDNPVKNGLQKIQEVSKDLTMTALKEYDEAQVIFNKIYPLIKTYIDDLKCIFDQVLDQGNNATSKEKGIEFSLSFKNSDRLRSIARRCIKKQTQLQPLLNKYSSLVKKSAIIHLIIGPIIIFLFFIHKINTDSIVKWPTVIKDNEMLKSLNKRAYEYFITTNEELGKYLSAEGNMIDLSVFSSLKKNFGWDYEKYMLTTITSYLILNYEKEIKNVCNSLGDTESEYLGRFIYYYEYSNLLNDPTQYLGVMEKICKAILSDSDKDKKN